MFDSEEEIMSYLMENNAVELHGMTIDGEITYKFNFEVLKEILPELYDVIMADIDESVMSAYQDGFVDIEYNEKLEAGFRVTEKGIQHLKDNGKDLPDFYKDK